MNLNSPAFTSMGMIPKKYTCQGDDLSPPLVWTEVPESAQSLMLVVDDPDAPDPQAPKMTFVHWVLYNLPATARGIPEGVKSNDLPEGTLEGINDYKRTGWGGPCPPKGRHRYFFKLYALDTVLPNLTHPNKAELEKAAQQHVLAKTELVGTCQK